MENNPDFIFDPEYCEYAVIHNGVIISKISDEDLATIINPWDEWFLDTDIDIKNCLTTKELKERLELD